MRVVHNVNCISVTVFWHCGTLFNIKLWQSVIYLNQLTNMQCCRSPVCLNCHTELVCNLTESEDNWKTSMLSTDSKLKSKRISIELTHLGDMKTKEYLASRIYYVCYVPWHGTYDVIRQFPWQGVCAGELSLTGCVFLGSP